MEFLREFVGTVRLSVSSSLQSLKFVRSIFLLLIGGEREEDTMTPQRGTARVRLSLRLRTEPSLVKMAA